MTSPSEEFAKYPYYDAKIQKNQAYRPDDGEHIKPIGYFSEIKGTTVIKIATSIFIKDLRLCIPPPFRNNSSLVLYRIDYSVAVLFVISCKCYWHIKRFRIHIY